MHERLNTLTMPDEGSEEGEIVDSDEENNMRLRIEELEAKNDELEKIATISGDYTNQYSYSSSFSTYKDKSKHTTTKNDFCQYDVARIPSDASTISSDEYEPVKKRHRRKDRHSKKELHNKYRPKTSHLSKRRRRSHNFESSNFKVNNFQEIHKRNKRVQRSSSPIVVNDSYLETISIDSDESSDQNKKDNSFRDDYDNDECSIYLNRDKLRFALARDGINENKPTGNFLKERLCNGKNLEQKENKNLVGNDILDVDLSKDPIIIENNIEVLEKDESATQEEQELRLIALKSAVLKKHLARKKRNAEMAYSPTDFEPVVTNESVLDDNMDVVEDELNDLDDVMEISPINSPKLSLNLDNEDDISQNDFRSIADDKSVRDMDIVDTASDDESYNSANTGRIEQWCPIDVAPITTGITPVNEVLKYPLPVHYGIYVPEMQYQLPPPLKIPAYQEEELANEKQTQVQVQPPLPILHFDTSVSMNHCGLETMNEESSKSTSLVQSQLETDSISRHSPFEVHTASEKDNGDGDKDSDEEASALRAVLLSKLQSAKCQKKNLAPNDTYDEYRLNSENDCQTDSKPNKNYVESVLQKALRRLKSNFGSTASNSKENDAHALSEIPEKFNESIVVEALPANSVLNDDHIRNGKPEVRLGKMHNLTRNRIIKKIMNKALRSKTAAVMTRDHSTTPTIDITEEEKSRDTCDSNSDNNVVDIKMPSDDSSSLGINTTEEISKNINETKIDIQPKNHDLKSLQKVEVSEKRIVSNPAKKNSIVNENGKIKCTEADIKGKVAATITTQTKVQPLSVKNNLVATSVTKPNEHLSPILSRVRTTKIVRRNKIINKEVTTSMKRTIPNVDLNSAQLSKMQRTIINTNASSLNQLRGISDTHTPRIVVKKLIINLGDSDSVTSDEEFLTEVRLPLNNSINRLKRSADTYSDIASPLELLMSSASCSPAPSKSTSETPKTPLEKSTTSEDLRAVNPAFEQKLDNFLKGIREKGSLTSSTTKTSKHSPIKCLTNETAKILNTPLAVRHLPLASQDEYRRLVHRMKLLEKQKQSKKSDDDLITPAKPNMSVMKSIPSVAKTTITTSSPIDKSKKIVTEETQMKILRSYENSFLQTSDNIMRILNKSLSVVAEAKKAKISKLRHEKRLQDLRIEMERLEAQISQEDRKFTSMKPHLGASNQFLTTLKKKRRSILENATKLGKTLEGDKYRINNKTGNEIIAKSRKLQTEIKFVNLLKIENIDLVLSKLNNMKSSDEQQSKKLRTKSVGTDVVNEIRIVNENNDDEKAVSSTQSLIKCSPHENLAGSTPKNSIQRDNTNGIEVSANKSHVDQEVHQEHVVVAKDVSANSLDEVVERIVPEYISPLEHFQNVYGNMDFNAIVCPFEMWGKCADNSCKYMHMTVGREQESELIIKPLKFGSDSMVQNFI